MIRLSMIYSRDNIFYRIINREVQVKIILENEEFIAFPDIKPQANKHILCVPKFEYTNFTEMINSNPKLTARFGEFMMEILKIENIKSYRLITNCGSHAGQSVMHLHWHILSNDGLSQPLAEF